MYLKNDICEKHNFKISKINNFGSFLILNFNIYHFLGNVEPLLYAS